MTTIINATTGEVLYCTPFEPINLGDNETILEDES